MPNIVVTGASAGVGRAVAIEFARHGCDVALLARGQERLESAAAEARRLGVRAVPICVDVADAEAVERAADRIEGELGPIDVWVNNAMVTIFSPVHQIAPEEFRRVTEVTYLGQVHGTLAALKRMRKRNCGTIVQIGSALSYRSIPLQSAYCAAKFAVRGFTDALRSELAHEGHVEADLTARGDGQFTRHRKRYRHRFPLVQHREACRRIALGKSVLWRSARCAQCAGVVRHTRIHGEASARYQIW